MTDPLTLVLSKLQGVRQMRERQWQALCPAHDDKSPSMSVSIGDAGHVGVCCHVGCATEDIVAAMGLEMRELFAPRLEGQKADAWITYDYHDAAGALVYQVVRIPQPGGGKDFRQRRKARPDDPAETIKRDNWVYNLKKTARVLYRLPDVLAAPGNGRRVYVVEGEKDADRLRRAGLVATCNSGGAMAMPKTAGAKYRSKWREEFSKALTGADVIVLPDNDDAGRAHAASVAAMTSPYANTIRIVELPGLAVKGDVSDWLNAGGTVDEIGQLADALPELATDKPPERDTSAPIERDSDPVLAREFLATIQSEGPPLVYDEGYLHRYDSALGVWAPMSGHAARVAAGDALDGRWVMAGKDEQGEPKVRRLNLKKSRIDGVADYASSLAYQPGHFAGYRRGGVGFGNGFVTIGAGGVDIEPHSPDNRSRAVVPCDFDATSDAPRWRQFLREVLAPDADQVSTGRIIQEFFGACLLGIATDYQRCIVLHGGGANGKSVMLEVLGALFPPELKASVSPHDISRSFVVAQLAGKRVNIVNETPDSDLAGSVKFKAICDGSPVTVEHKNKAPFTMRCQAGHVFAANALFGGRDTSHGFFRRFIIIPMVRTFEEHEQQRGLGDEIIRAELQGVAAWAVQGALRLLQQKRYTESKTAIAAADEWELMTNKVRQWVEEKCRVTDRKSGSSTEELYPSFRMWCLEFGYSPMNKAKFGGKLNELKLEARSTRKGTSTAKLRPLRTLQPHERIEPEATSAFGF